MEFMQSPLAQNLQQNVLYAKKPYWSCGGDFGVARSFDDTRCGTSITQLNPQDIVLPEGVSCIPRCPDSE